MAILVGFTGTLLLGGWFTLEGALEVGAYSVLVFMTQRLLWPLTRLGETFDLYQRAMASTARILDLIEAPDSLVDGEGPHPRGGRRPLRLENVTFAHPGRETVLDGITSTLSANRGHRGLNRIWEDHAHPSVDAVHRPKRGAVTWCGHDLREWSTPPSAQHGLGGQHVTLFPPA